MLYSVFAFQLALITVFAVLSNFWLKDNGGKHFYLGKTREPGILTIIIQLLSYWIAYSHLIPISLYVVLEMIKMGQAQLINVDVRIYDEATGFSMCRNSDLIEEMGQVEFVFSDKTGTLTCNVMEFKQCTINNKIYENFDQMRAVFQLPASNPDRQASHEFFKLMAVCHSVVIDKDPKGGIKMSASSPDELALVEGAKEAGYRFVDRTSTTVEYMVDYETPENKHNVWSVLVEFPFDSTRKRMSALVREEKTGQIWLMTKGADSIMMPRLSVDKEFQ